MTIALGATIVSALLAPGAQAAGILPGTNPAISPTGVGKDVGALLHEGPDIAAGGVDQIGIEPGALLSPPPPGGVGPTQESRGKRRPRPTGIVRNPEVTSPAPAPAPADAPARARETAPGRQTATRGRQSRPARRPSSGPKGRAAGSAPSPGTVGAAGVKAGRGPQRPRTFGEVVSSIPDWIKAALTLTSLLLVLSLLSVLRGRRKLEQALSRAHRDIVTGLPNRAAVDEALRRMAGQAARKKTPLAVAMLDLDHFKSINDTYGHGVGDEVLAAVGAAARSEVRSGDFVGRFGGEEFMILMPDTDEDGAYVVAEMLRSAFCEIAVAGVDRAITASFGVSGGRGTDEMLLGLVSAADAALYRAKANGRDRTEAASRPATSSGPDGIPAPALSAPTLIGSP